MKHLMVTWTDIFYGIGDFCQWIFKGMKVGVFIIFLGILACGTGREETAESEDKKQDQEITFDPVKWKTKEGVDYPYREGMLNELVYNDTIRTLTKGELLDLLGKPDRINENHLYYNIAQTRVGTWPLNTKTLVIKISEEGTIVWIKIHG